MNDRPDIERRNLVRRLGWASVGLGVPLVAMPERMATLVGLDDSRTGPMALRGVGVRELAQGALLFASPGLAVWTRLAGDAADLTMLRKAMHERRGERRTRVRAAAGAVLGLTAVDLYAAARSVRDRQHGPGRPGPLELQATITVNKSPEETYGYWRDFERLPTFMRHLESVRVDADGRSTWTATAPFGTTVQWQAEMTGDEPGRRISWKSLPGSRVDNAGTVHFATTPDGSGTEVKVVLHYDVPAGSLGRAVAKLLGEEPEQQVRDDLRRFKQVLETGDITRSDAFPDGTTAGKQGAQRPAQPLPSSDGTSRKGARA